MPTTGDAGVVGQDPSPRACRASEGEVDRVYSLESRSRADALDDAKSEASQKAIDAGANAATVQIVDVEDVPLTYLPGNATRIRVKAVGDLTL